MGIFSKKTKSHETSTSTNQNTSTITPNVPDWIADPSKQLAGQVGQNIQQGPGAYTPQVSELQKQSFADAAKLGTAGNPYLGQAGDVLGGIGDVGATSAGVERANAAGILDNGLEQYYNPFRDQIIDPVLGDLDENAGRVRAAQSAAAARNRSFQGSRYGITEGQTEGELARARGATLSPLLTGMYEHATGLAEADTGRRQQTGLANASASNTAALANAAAANQAAQANRDAQFQRAQQLAALGQTTGSEERANLGIRAGMGATATDQENAIRQYPLEYQRQQEALLAGLNPELYTGKTADTSGTQTGVRNSKSSSSDMMGSLGQVAQIAALFASDLRLKHDVRTVGFDAKGRRWVSFAYIWEPLKRFVGVIAQEVLRTDPDAVVMGPNGFLMVNYGGLR